MSEWKKKSPARDLAEMSQEKILNDFFAITAGQEFIKTYLCGAWYLASARYINQIYDQIIPTRVALAR